MAEAAGPRSLRQLLDAVLTIGSDLDLEGMLRRIIEAAVDLVDARYGALGVLDPTGTRLSQFITVGIDENGRRAIGELPEGHGILGLLIIDAKPLRLPDLREHPDSYGFPPNHPPMTSFLGVPIRLRDDVFGNLYLTDKTTSEVFTDVDEELVVGLAAAASVAIENARLHDRLHDLAVVEDRERIARDLHDTVIQRLFATGLALQASIRMIRTDPDTATTRIEAAIDDLDTTVKHIRTAIFDLETARPLPDGLRSNVLQLVRELAPTLDTEPRVLFDGPIDTGVTHTTATETLTVLREALTNIAKHAHAHRVDIELTATTDHELVLRVRDDGTGISGEALPGHGITNMDARAHKLGGTLTLAPRQPTGTELIWRVPRT
jgi:signal transduction histidine kinase